VTTLREGITFDDVLILPAYSEIESRSAISLRQEFLDIKMELPIISANMDFITGSEMAIAMRVNGALGILHRFYPTKMALMNNIKEIAGKTPIILSVGTRSIYDALLLIDSVLDNYLVHAICIDVAHGEHKKVVELITQLRTTYQNQIYIIAGNVATANGYLRLARAGADAIKVGIGPGSVCTTRSVTGVGVPQLTAIMDVNEARKSWYYGGPKIIADGGINNSGDIVKALAAGADLVMLGNLLAGANETPGDVRVAPDNSRWRPYRGQSMFGSNESKFVPEGIEGFVKEKGPVSEILRKLAAGIRSGMSYVGANNLTELRENAEFIRISHSTHNESGTRVGQTI